MLARKTLKFMFPNEPGNLELTRKFQIYICD